MNLAHQDDPVNDNTIDTAGCPAVGVMMRCLLTVLVPAAAAAGLAAGPFAPAADAFQGSEPRAAIEARARSALVALGAKDTQHFSTYVHPTRGVRFSPYVYVDEAHLVFRREEVVGLLQQPTVRIWGYYDGSGEPIEGTFAEYFMRFVYDQDFTEAPQQSFNAPIGVGNTRDNAAEFYPDGMMVEYHFPGFDPDFGGMDWRSLRLVFEELDGEWFVVAVIHAQWTI